MLPMMKYTPSGDQARSYISAPDDRHICFVLHTSLSSVPSPPKAGTAVLPSSKTHRMILPSSPAEASRSPRGAHRTQLTACVCFAKVARYSIFRSSPSGSSRQSYFHTQVSGICQGTAKKRLYRGVSLTLTLLSPAPVASLPLSPFWKSAEYIGALDSCQLMINGLAFMAAAGAVDVVVHAQCMHAGSSGWRDAVGTDCRHA